MTLYTHERTKCIKDLKMQPETVKSSLSYLLPPSLIVPGQKVLYTLLLCLHGPGIRYFPFLD